jgi:hypothetical protein
LGITRDSEPQAKTEAYIFSCKYKYGLFILKGVYFIHDMYMHKLIHLCQSLNYFYIFLLTVNKERMTNASNATC